MKKHPSTKKIISLILACGMLLSSCTSTTMIQSTPKGAKLYLDGQVVGKTPYLHSDTKIVGSTTFVKLEKEGYEPLNASFSRNEQVDIGAVIGGVLVWVPFLWTMKYNPTHSYELSPSTDNFKSTTKTNKQPEQAKSKAERLRELKQLLDEKAITQTEYDVEKKKILDEILQ